MKRLTITLVALVLMTTSALAQSKIFEDLYYECKHDDETTTLSMTGNLLSLAAFFADDGEEEDMFRELGKSVDRIKLIRMEINDRSLLSLSDARQVKKDLISGDNFAELMTIRDGNDNIDVLAIEDEGLISEIIMIAEADDEFVIMDITGNIDLKNLDQLVEVIDMDMH